MKYVKFGNTGLDVSPICLGCMSFGDVNRWTHEWVLPEADSRAIIKASLDLGINFFDTANIYSKGASEEITGRALRDYARREEIVVATKVHQQMNDGCPNSGGLSRKEIFYQLDQSLERLGMDYVDLYIIHRWDYNTPIEETMEALHDVVKSGKVRYIGASAMYAWQFQKALHIAEKNNWTRFVSMQNHLNLLYREEEREMMALCVEEKIAVTPYSPLAAGRLTRDWEATTKRFKTDQVAKYKYDSTQAEDYEIVTRVAEIAKKYNVTRAQIALAWLLQKAGVVSPIIGVTKVSHLEDACGAIDVQLVPDDIAYLEAIYKPHQVVGALNK